MRSYHLRAHKEKERNLEEKTNRTAEPTITTAYLEKIPVHFGGAVRLSPPLRGSWEIKFCGGKTRFAILDSRYWKLGISLGGERFRFLSATSPRKIWRTLVTFVEVKFRLGKTSLVENFNFWQPLCGDPGSFGIARIYS